MLVLKVKYCNDRTDYILHWEDFGRTLKLWAGKVIEYFELNGLLCCSVGACEIKLLGAKKTVGV